jgi:GNAT superfamily N-acetyltransferase
MQRTYQELYPEQNFSHLAQTVEQYFSTETPLWWVAKNTSETASNPPPISLSASYSVSDPIACLWLGTAIDQVEGWRYPHIFLLYVCPDHRRQGIGLALMHHAELWAKARGHHQIGLQVFQQNQPALQLYTKLGYQTQSLSMVKPLVSDSLDLTH